MVSPDLYPRIAVPIGARMEIFPSLKSASVGNTNEYGVGLARHEILQANSRTHRDHIVGDIFGINDLRSIQLRFQLFQVFNVDTIALTRRID